MNNPISFMDPLGLDTVRAGDMDKDKWKDFDTKKDVIDIEEVDGRH
ncbi:hypothetical protein [Sphingobacterium sp. UBA6645]|nr:hypothetical protein [Sphingobacterium sp. UBA6645]